MDFNACDEMGRLDISRMEDGSGDKASEAQMEAWKRGEITLYSAIYTTEMQFCSTAEW